MLGQGRETVSALLAAAEAFGPAEFAAAAGASVAANAAIRFCHPFGEARSLYFWRLEGGLIRENWVLVDLLDMYRQIGVDLLARMRKFGRGRASFGAAA